eukprot:scaffold152297_cov30-Tisochrysis_lutea.AAC.3
MSIGSAGCADQVSVSVAGNVSDIQGATSMISDGLICNRLVSVGSHVVGGFARRVLSGPCRYPQNTPPLMSNVLRSHLGFRGRQG